MQKYDVEEIEQEVLKFWQEKGIYEKAKAKNQGAKKFYYLDGPPYTSGKVHVGTAWGKVLRDSIMRFLRMKGLDVWDRPGFDMHGLPTSHKVEAKLHLESKDDIGVKVPVNVFVKECRNFATENMHLMIKDFKRLGVWMNWDDPYIPINKPFIEGNWWLIKKAQENGYLYEGKKVMSWCPKCATSLAKHELEYENVVDNSIFVKCKVMVDEKGKDKSKENEYLVIWTTTPWTIPFNMAVMVNPDLDYVRCKIDGDKSKGEDNEVWIIAKGLAAPVVQAVADKKLHIIEEFKGEVMEGLKYRQPFFEEIQFHQEETERSKKAKKGEQSHFSYSVILSKEYVTLTAGSGLVHCAPGCGPEDYEVGHEYKIPAYNEIDEKGQFPKSMGKFAGLIAKKDDAKFIEALDKKHLLIAKTPVEHEYAHCWRCKSPVVFKTTTQWFFDVESELKEKMIELNKGIKWVPEWAGNKWFDSWLRNLRDNGITRQMVWGTPLPIWRCEKESCRHFEVIGSIPELEKKVGKENIPDDLHIPWIDELKWKCEKCGSVMKRIPDVLDVWIDAGTTCWNCLDYPHREDHFKELWPADLILEGKDQIRGWFNLLFVASMVAMKQPSYKAVYMHGFISDFEGRKMSKSLGNVVSPYEVIDKHGSDTLRFYLITASNPGLDLNFSWEDVKQKQRTLTVIWNIHNLLIDLAKTNSINPKQIKGNPRDFGPEEQYMLSKLNTTIEKTTNAYENYLLNEAPMHVEELLLELSRTYIQLTRDKAAMGTDEEKEAVIYTIFHTMLEGMKLLTPACPMIAEKIYLNLHKEFGLEKESISLYPWPKADKKLIDDKLESEMDIAKEAIASILGARDKLGLGVRWPILKATVICSSDEAKKAVDNLTGIIKSQTNVKSIDIAKEYKDAKIDVKFNFSRMGPDFGKDAPAIISELSKSSAKSILEKIGSKGYYEVKTAGNKHQINNSHLIVEKQVPEGILRIESKAGEIYIDTARNDELDAEGYAREIMRRVQDARKKAGMQKSDEIILFIHSKNGKILNMIRPWKDQIADKVGAQQASIELTEPEHKKEVHETAKIKGIDILICFDKVK